MKDLRKLFADISSLKVVVLGDVMLDTYMWGKVERISPEAPVPVVTLHHKEYRIGGAGNVALNCAALGAAVSLVSVTGDDADSKLLINLLQSSDIDASYVVRSIDRITTNKTRIIGRNQQMMRVDAELTEDLKANDEMHLLEKIKICLAEKKPDVLIFEDYNKGVLTESVIQQTIQLCQGQQIVTAVDPKRKNFFSYKQADLFKPNLKEVKEALNILVSDAELPLLKNIHEELHRMLDHRVSLITLSEKGIFFESEKESGIIPSHLRNIADVSGAGDTVIAVASMAYAVTKDVNLMAAIANIAGGLVCEDVGTVAINKERLIQECELLLK